MEAGNYTVLTVDVHFPESYTNSTPALMRKFEFDVTANDTVNHREVRVGREVCVRTDT